MNYNYSYFITVRSETENTTPLTNGSGGIEVYHIKYY